MAEKVKDGIWTPWAEVLCYECHGNVFRGVNYGRVANTFRDRVIDPHSEKWKQAVSEIDVQDGNGITTCDQCTCLIQIYESIAGEHNLAIALQKEGIDASMWQTGGMNSACGVNKTDDGHYLVTFNFDGVDEGYCVAECAEDGESMNPANEFTTPSLPEVIDHFKTLQNVLKVELNQGGR